MPCCFSRQVFKFLVQLRWEIGIFYAHTHWMAHQVKVTASDCLSQQLEVAEPESLPFCAVPLLHVLKLDPINFMDRANQKIPRVAYQVRLDSLVLVRNKIYFHA